MKKLILIVMMFCIGNLFIFASFDNTSIYTVETESEIIIDQLYESKNVETYKFIIDNAIENGCINVTYYIDDKAVKTSYNVLVFQDETNVSYIREEKGMIRNNDLIMQFENNYNNHNYRIEFKYGVDTM